MANELIESHVARIEADVSQINTRVGNFKIDLDTSMRREFQNAQTRFDHRLDSTVTNFERRLSALEARFERFASTMDGRLDAMATRFNGKLETLGTQCLAFALVLIWVAIFWSIILF